MTAIININTGEIQENTPYQTIEDLIAYGLKDYRFASDEEISAYNTNKEAEAKNNAIKAQLAEIDTQSQTTRPLREYMLSQGYTGFNNKIQNAENQAIKLRSQLIQ